MVWGKAGSTTLTSDSGTIDTTITGSTFNQFMIHALESGTIDSKMRFGVDTADGGSNYGVNQAVNGGSWGKYTGTSIDVGIGNYSDDAFHVGYFCNIAGEPKLFIERLAH